MISAIILQHLHQRQSGIAQPAPLVHFFCSRSAAEPERSDARDILRSLAKQVSLTEKGDSLRLPLVQVYDERRNEAGHTGERPAPLTVEDCIDVICEVGRASPLRIVIDGLDECNSQQREILLDGLKQIRQRCRDVVKTLVSSRHEVDIAVYMEQGVSLEVTPQSNDEDLKQFVNARVEGFIEKWSTMHDDSADALEKLGEEITEKLMSGSQGM